jgi:site-specific DNA recombinase
MKAPSAKLVRCAIYTRVSTEHGLDQEFNSLDAQSLLCQGGARR